MTAPEPVPLAQTWDHPGEYECYPPGTVAALEARLRRIAAVAMAGAEVLDTISYFNGAKTIAAYDRFDRLWMTTLSAEDMTYMRGVVGLPEPVKAQEGDDDGE